MAPALVLEVRAEGEWREVNRLGPSAAPGSLSHNGPQGRQVYVFRCLGHQSVLQRSQAGADLAHGDLRVLSSSASGFEDVARLTSEDPTAEFWLRPDNVVEPVRFRFRHQP
jgi:hypothetical protein